MRTIIAVSIGAIAILGAILVLADRGHSGHAKDVVVAKAIADSFTGFADSEDVRSAFVSASSLTASEACSIPFISKRLLGSTVWKISYRSVNVSKQSSDVAAGLHLRDFEVFVDSASGRFLCARSVDSTASEWPAVHLKSLEQIEEKFAQAGWYFEDVFDSIPVSLSIIMDRSPVSVHRAREIEAICVYLKTPSSDIPQPRWLLSLWGIPPIPFFGPESDSIDIAYRTSSRIGFDARSGKLLDQCTPVQ